MPVSPPRLARRGGALAEEPDVGSEGRLLMARYPCHATLPSKSNRCRTMSVKISSPENLSSSELAETGKNHVAAMVEAHSRGSAGMEPRLFCQRKRGDDACLRNRYQANDRSIDP
jgi:hypothetical protein